MKKETNRLRRWSLGVSVGWTGFALGLLACAVPSFAQTNDVCTDPVGFYSIRCMSNSDTRVSLPFARPAAYSGLVGLVGNNSIVVSGNPNWTAGQFGYAAGTQSNTYYAFFATGQKEGLFLTVTNNTADSLSAVLDVVADLSGVGVGDRVMVVPYWTLGTAFPGGRGINPTTSPLQRQTEVLVFDPGSVGVNVSSTATYYFYQGHWRQVGQPVGASHDDDVLLPDSHFIVRQSNGAPTTTWVPMGMVVMRKLTAPLYTHSATKQDNVVGLQRPGNVTLSESGLAQSGAFAPTVTPLYRTDELLYFDNTVIGINKSATATYYYYNGGWRKVGLSPTTDVGADPVFMAGTGLIIRKNTNTTSATTFWINAPNY